MVVVVVSGVSISVIISLVVSSSSVLIGFCLCVVVLILLVLNISIGMYNGRVSNVMRILECWMFIVSVVIMLLIRFSIGVFSSNDVSRIGSWLCGMCSILVSSGVMVISGSVVVVQCSSICISISQVSGIGVSSYCFSELFLVLLWNSEFSVSWLVSSIVSYSIVVLI